MPTRGPARPLEPAGQASFIRGDDAGPWSCLDKHGRAFSALRDFLIGSDYMLSL